MFWHREGYASGAECEMKRHYWCATQVHLGVLLRANPPKFQWQYKPLWAAPASWQSFVFEEGTFNSYTLRVGSELACTKEVTGESLKEVL